MAKNNLLNNLFFTQNRPQWLIAPLPVQPYEPPAPTFSASAMAGGLLPNVAQAANEVSRYSTAPFTPYFTDAQFDAAQDYSQRVILSPIGGPIG